MKGEGTFTTNRLCFCTYSRSQWKTCQTLIWFKKQKKKKNELAIWVFQCVFLVNNGVMLRPNLMSSFVRRLLHFCPHLFNEMGFASWHYKHVRLSLTKHRNQQPVDTKEMCIIRISARQTEANKWQENKYWNLCPPVWGSGTHMTHVMTKKSCCMCVFAEVQNLANPSSVVEVCTFVGNMTPTEIVLV